MNVGVLFASIPCFKDVNDGIESIELLNEVIHQYDAMFDDTKYQSIEKIKTIASTYMAASGLSAISECMHTPSFPAL
jgi:adenylate cyclase 2